MRRSRTRLSIVGGELRGRHLEVAPGVRPTEARVRAALFSIWQERVAGCRFLDLFAGSGAVGLEALSRGAADCCFVDSEPRALAALRRNCGRLAAGGARVLRRRLPADLSADEIGVFELIFADPPYSFTRYGELLASVESWLAPGGQVAVEHSSRRPVNSPSVAPFSTGRGDAPSVLQRIDERRYGESCLSFFSRPAG